MNARSIIEAESPKKALVAMRGRPGGPIKSIEIAGKRWFQRTYGNTYFSARIYVNDQLVHAIPFDYGYGGQYEQAGWEWLAENGYVKPKRFSSGGYQPGWHYCLERGIKYLTYATDVRRRGQL